MKLISIKKSLDNIYNKISSIRKAFKLLSSIDIIETKDSIFINISSNIIINHNKHLVINGEGYLITKHVKTHINPEIKINIADVHNTIQSADIKATLKYKQNLFSSLLKHNKIKQVNNFKPYKITIK